MLFSGPNRERLNRIASVFLAVGLLRGSPVFAGPSVDEIVARAEQAAYYQGQDGRASVSMRITDKQGRERKRRFTILRSNSAGGEGEQKYYVHIASPSDLRNTVLMVWKHPAGEDDRWLYLPGLDLAKRIASGDKRTSFLGSDFYYEDISGRSPQHDRHVLKETTDNFYVLDNTPKNPESVEFSHFLAWIHKQTYLPVKVQFFDRSGEPQRTYEALKVENVQGRPTVTHSRIRDHALAQETDLVFDRVSYDLGLPEAIFTERYLRNPPRQYLR